VNGEFDQGGRNRLEYALTLEAAKHIAMLSGTDKGFEVREYFIECESKLNKPMSMLEMVLVQAQAMVDQERKNALIQAQVQTIATRVEAIESIHKHVEEELSRLPEPANEAPELTPYDATRMVVADYCDRNKLTDGREFARCYTQIYEHLNARYGVRLGACRKMTPKESLLQVADRLGHIDKVYTLALELFAPKDKVIFRIKERA